MANYIIRRYSPQKVLLDEAISFHSLSLVRTLNKVGGVEIVFPLWHETDNFSNNQLIDIFRDGSIHGETSYFLKKWRFFEDDEGRPFVQLIGLDANWLLVTRLVAYNVGTAQSEMTGPADNMMKDIFDDNFGADADAARQLADFTAQPQNGYAASLTKSFSRRLLLDIYQELANASTSSGTRLLFDVVRTDVGVFQLRTYLWVRGTNHGQGSGDERVVSKAEGNLIKPELVVDHTGEANFIYAGGKGEETEREIQTAFDATRIANGSPYNRVEGWIDAGNAEDSDAVLDEANAELTRRTPKKTLTCQIVPTRAMQYNVHFGFGDALVAEVFNETFDCLATSVRLDVDKDNRETLSIALRGEK